MGDLVAVFVNSLVEIALSVQDANGYKGYTEVTGSLAMIACENTKPP